MSSSSSRLSSYQPKVTTQLRARKIIDDAFAQALAESDIHPSAVSSPTSTRELRDSIAKGSPKKKCCRSHPRCKKCPTVMHRLRRAGALKLDDNALKAALVKARKW
ncbi:hypothetical protein N7326_04705 [Corynebacterium sp. ES2794-CONJ1]|uniref:hypothetical protein n=1 Tax=unclassified Corynebacterium TaxID=2624378 RepID=UPI002169D1AF|nr:MULTISPECIES: hypothetical protein [unclassified Corynebacterium]MCS4489965.1 hypothetical protein [Corynebacterium sp. ES2775-CONJ]MCS4491672.1 hypothetical protein [Corynebacterium sp. ES2715-CONJ3]MCS4531777.1 hypothetical protein [Corynebacterium sp. ES2730-CONJ]MCU9519173.1 hypothetical protein [Corynebacterium sp. ES2794-CONJ1]